jgi:ABC-type glycerol-3-phosphate transport system substrate-binding protein
LPASTLFFIAGKLGFYFGPSWRMFEIDEQNPNLKYEVTAVPQFPTIEGEMMGETDEGSLTNIHWASYWVEGVNTKSKYQKEAWKFLEYMASKDGLSKMYQTASQIRSFGEIYPRKSMAVEISSNLKLKTFVATADQATSWYLTSRTFDQGLNDEMISYFQNAINKIVINGVAAADVMPDLRNGVNQLVQKYQIK